MENKLSKADRTRQFIIETTAGIFNMKGYAGTSMSDITEATGLTKGSIYGNFGNKEDVALAVFDHNYSKVSQVIQQRIQQATTYHDKLMVYAQVYDQFTRGSFPVGGCPVLNTAIEADDTNSLLKDRAAKAVLKWKKTIQDLIQGGVAAGEFKEGLDHTQIALSIIALIEGAIMIAKVTNSQSNMDKIMQTVELLINQMKA
ncbi:transcriptional regulator, TetR family [Mucilaginibacter mallensis]|uniref:Transcriptional regulator, TetR family n=1 Tax=Mucilaginibacter mallensis TaxID=652787 RepID=A0A1H1UBW3_MUCMA|nr:MULTISPECIES: TetR/AcrR family transcriptional regulator [Mucilaginibacter]MBB6137498.1 AcrR family transcriptional regulator [Mucilaginibacter sp. X5P1]SDS69429.1 transcriptional regulator, TetR family [Mucilaginibacter mallensis]